ncbi:DMT family transporter [Actinorugispora endophytica]|uniref:Magnesium transporter NIPA n=1 Tax=Actinorugispora endophytica TaxID=1605990 RepID=A0A4R6UIP8_9ACTN|nr:DMT family transporter [Actinorugispora endophytica]TDQ46342.1 hypothetical protein EV190_12529 [Actinorugispora endophytica]
MSTLWIAVGLSVASAVCYGGGAVTQRRLAGAVGGHGTLRRAVPALLEQRLWWLSVALNAAGAALHALALVYGTLVVVQPLGTLVLVFALPWSAWLAARRVSAREWHGVVLTVGALSVMLVAAGSGPQGHTLSDQGGLWLSLAAAAAVGALALAGARASAAVPRGLLLAAASGVAFGTASALTKAVLHAAAEQGVWALLGWTGLGLVVLACAGVLLSQAAYARMDVGAPLAVMTLANPLAAAAAGVLFMGEGYAGGSWGAGVTVLAAIVAARGVFLLCVVPEGPAAPPVRRGDHPGASSRRS